MVKTLTERQISLLKNIDVNPDEFVNMSDSDKYIELSDCYFSVFEFYNVFDNPAYMLLFPPELRDLIEVGGDIEYFFSLSDQTKLKYLRSLDLNVYDFAEYITFMKRKAEGNKKDRIARLMAHIAELTKQKNDCESIKEELEFHIDKLEVKLGDISSKYNELARESKKLLEYLDGFKKKIQEQNEELEIKDELIGRLKYEIAALNKKEVTAKVEKHEENKERVNKKIWGDYSKTKAYIEAIKAAEVPPYSKLD